VTELLPGVPILAKRAPPRPPYQRRMSYRRWVNSLRRRFSMGTEIRRMPPSFSKRRNSARACCGSSPQCSTAPGRWLRGSLIRKTASEEHRRAESAPSCDLDRVTCEVNTDDVVSPFAKIEHPAPQTTAGFPNPSFSRKILQKGGRYCVWYSHSSILSATLSFLQTWPRVSRVLGSSSAL
jgi:hypothetical protein